MWRADLDCVGDELLHVLNEDEHDRAERFPRRSGGLMWARSRAILRTLLARYLNADPARLILRAEPSGRLVLPDPCPISFSLSHSGASALYAFARLAGLGVDIEGAARSLNESALARRLLDPERKQQLEELGPQERRRALIQAWTRREALVKCGPPGAVLTRRWLFDLDVGPSECAALAVRRAMKPQVLCRSWARG